MSSLGPQRILQQTLSCHNIVGEFPFLHEIILILHKVIILGYSEGIPPILCLGPAGTTLCSLYEIGTLYVTAKLKAQAAEFRPNRMGKEVILASQAYLKPLIPPDMLCSLYHGFLPPSTS